MSAATIVRPPRRRFRDHPELAFLSACDRCGAIVPEGTPPSLFGGPLCGACATATGDPTAADPDPQAAPAIPDDHPRLPLRFDRPAYSPPKGERYPGEPVRLYPVSLKPFRES